MSAEAILHHTQQPSSFFLFREPVPREDTPNVDLGLWASLTRTEQDVEFARRGGGLSIGLLPAGNSDWLLWYDELISMSRTDILTLIQVSSPQITRSDKNA